jgi:hypothetical protein
MKITLEIRDLLDIDGIPSGKIEVQMAFQQPLKFNSPKIGAVDLMDKILGLIKEKMNENIDN